MAATLAGTGVDVGMVAARIEHLPVRLHSGEGTTWVLVGLDGRAGLPAGATAAEFGSAADLPGDRADVVVVVHEGDEGTTVLSVPRDLVVQGPSSHGRLALSWLDGPQETVDALCALGVPSDHLVAVDLAGFAALVDAAGGLRLDVDRTVRDPQAGLAELPAGPHRLDGRTALALVRSRHPEHLVDGIWVPADVDPDGRAAAAAAVLQALYGAVAESVVHPLRLHDIAWAASDALEVDEGTSFTDLLSLARLDVDASMVLPAQAPPAPDVLARSASPDTTAALAAAGMTCSP